MKQVKDQGNLQEGQFALGGLKCYEQYFLNVLIQNYWKISTKVFGFSVIQVGWRMKGAKKKKEMEQNIL